MATQKTPPASSAQPTPQPVQQPFYVPAVPLYAPGFTTLTSVVKTNKATLSDVASGYQYILAYVVAGAIFILIAQTRFGYRALYFGSLLLLMLLVVTQGPFIASALKPLSIPDTSQKGTTA